MPQAKILIVDDQLSAREVLRGLLTGQNYNMAYATNGEEALAMAADLVPDLILLDVMMPDMTGFEVCQRLRVDPSLSEVPVIMVTALDDQESRLRGLEAGADDFVTKPFSHVELIARVRSITRLNRYRRLLQERTYRQQAEEEVERRNRDLTLLNQVITTATSTLNIQDLLYTACKALAEVFNLPHVTALLLNEDRTKYTTIVPYLSTARLVDHSVSQASAEDNPIPLIGLLSGYLPQSQVVLKTGDNPPTDSQLVHIYQFMQEHGFGSLILEPVLIGDKVVGIFELKSTEKLVFNKQDLSLAQSVASSIGQALENALLYQKLKRHANDLEKTVAKRTVELQTERDRIKAILEALGEAVIVTDATGAIEYLNPAAISMTGFSEEDALGHNWRLLSDTGTWQQESNGSQEKLFEAILDTARSGEIWHGEVKNKRKVGTLYDALLTVAPLFHPEDPQQPIRFVAVQSDITSLKEAERIRTIHQENEKQAALDRLRHTFLSAINHELRTPLALMSQLIDMLEDSQLGELNAEQLDAVKSIDRQSKTLGQMVEGLTRVAAFLSKQETVRPVLGRLEPVFNNLIPLVEFKARSKEITVKNDIAPQLPPLRLDVKQLEEALIQIADNAIKFNEPGGQVQISAQADDDWVTISISDTGIGIDTELINRMWEIFEQGIDPVRRSQEGLGLGLVLAHYIIEAHNGSIEVETALGKGSTFMVRLPIAKRRIS